MKLRAAIGPRVHFVRPAGRHTYIDSACLEYYVKVILSIRLDMSVILSKLQSGSFFFGFRKPLLIYLFDMLYHLILTHN